MIEIIEIVEKHNTLITINFSCRRDRNLFHGVNNVRGTCQRPGFLNTGSRKSVIRRRGEASDGGVWIW